MSQATALEQYFLEFINAARAAVSAQPLAFNGMLNDAADGHSQWMIDTDIFSHTGVDGTNAYARMLKAGYSSPNAFNWGENISWASLRGAAWHNDEVQLLHTNLMNSPGHKANLLNADYKEVGLGFAVGQYSTSTGASYQGAFITQDFARWKRDVVFLTGVAFADKNGNGRYDPGEGLGGVTVTAVETGGAEYSTKTEPAGGYSLMLPPGGYQVSFAGGSIGLVRPPFTIGSRNVKLDMLIPGSVVPPPPVPDPPPIPNPDWRVITGTAAGETIRGTPGKDTILGLGGNDIIRSGAGLDVLTGGPGRDAFVFDTPLEPGVVKELTDFTGEDWIKLDNDVFTNWGANTGMIMSSQFYAGAAAHDSTDRIMYDGVSGNLIYDKDGTGPAQPVTIAKVGQDAVITRASVVIVQ